jgi:hypothetical protein
MLPISRYLQIFTALLLFWGKWHYMSTLADLLRLYPLPLAIGLIGIASLGSFAPLEHRLHLMPSMLPFVHL